MRVDKRCGSRGLYGAQAQIQRAGEQVVIVVGVRVATAHVLGRTGCRRVQHVGGRIKVMRMKTKAGKVFLEQRVGGRRRRRVQVHLLPCVLDQVRKLDSRIEQRSRDRYSLSGRHCGRLLLLLLLMVMRVRVMVLCRLMLLVLLVVVMVMVVRVSGPGHVRFEERADAKRFRVLRRGHRPQRLLGRRHVHHYGRLWRRCWLRWRR